MRTFLRVTLPFAGMNCINQASRIVVAIVAPALALEFGLSASALGALAAVFFAAYALTQLPVGLAIDMYGARRVQMVLALVAALGFALCGMATDTAMLAAGRFVTGIGIAAALIAIIKINVQWYPPDRLAALSGAAVFIGAGGGMAATLPVEWLLPLVGWRGVFLGLAGLSCLVSLWVALSVPKVAPGARPPATRRSLVREIAEFGRIFSHPAFTRYMPAVALQAGLVFTYQGLWAGPWLRDVAGMGGEARAGIMLFYALGMMVGSLVMGQLCSVAQRRGQDPMWVFFAGVAVMLVLQAALMLGPGDPALLALLWFGFAFAGSCGAATYSVLAQRFPPELAGRATTAMNGSMLALVFLLQNAVGWVLDFWPRTAAGGWQPVGYAWALGLTLAAQVVTVFWLWAAPRLRDSH